VVYEDARAFEQQMKQRQDNLRLAVETPTADAIAELPEQSRRFLAELQTFHDSLRRFEGAAMTFQQWVLLDEMRRG
jgi:hypothetical protein